MKKRHVIGLLVLSVALSHALSPAIAWAQFKVQNAFYSLTVGDTVTASGDVTADQYVASGSASQYSCSKTDGTCQFSSATADGTTSSTVGSFTFKAGANITAADLLLDVQDSAGAHPLKLTEAGNLQVTGQFISDNASGSAVQLVNGGGVNFSLADSYSYISRTAPNSLRVGVSGQGGSLIVSGSLTAGQATGDVIDATAGGYTRIKSGAAAPTATDCDAAGESGRMYVDTSASARWCVCDGVEWNCVAVAP